MWQVPGRKESRAGAAKVREVWQFYWGDQGGSPWEGGL